MREPVPCYRHVFSKNKKPATRIDPSKVNKCGRLLRSTIDHFLSAYDPFFTCIGQEAPFAECTIVQTLRRVYCNHRSFLQHQESNCIGGRGIRANARDCPRLPTSEERGRHAIRGLGGVLERRSDATLGRLRYDVPPHDTFVAPNSAQPTRKRVSMPLTYSRVVLVAFSVRT